MRFFILERRRQTKDPCNPGEMRRKIRIEPAKFLTRVDVTKCPIKMLSGSTVTTQGESSPHCSSTSTSSQVYPHSVSVERYNPHCLTCNTMLLQSVQTASMLPSSLSRPDSCCELIMLHLERVLFSYRCGC